MFTIYHSNDLDLLKDVICHIIDTDKIADPFRPETVLVQSPGMSQWLQIALAEKLGIAANIDFPLPATFIWDMFTRVLPGIPKESAFSKGAMTWKLMSLLPQRLEDPDFTPLRHYLDDDNDKRKLHQLSGRIADLFDQYLVYRPDWLTAWEGDTLVDGLSQNQAWQKSLWQDLQTLTRALDQPQWHRANLYQRFIDVLNQGDPHIMANLPPRLFICGISALPPVYLQALRALGQHTHIHLMFTNPCQYYWGDIQNPASLRRMLARKPQSYWDKKAVSWFKSDDDAPSLFNFEADGEQNIGNPLLASWGRLGRDNLWFLEEIDDAHVIKAFVDHTPDTLLTTVQQDILDLADYSRVGKTKEEFSVSKDRRILADDDRSLSFHSCHSPQREVEVLQDYLLNLLENNPLLTPRDIIVMVADIDSYSPYIQAVFGHGNDNRYLPFAISDRKARQAHPVLQAVLTLLELPQSRFTSEHVLSLLEVPAIAQQFGLDESDLPLLRRWVSGSGVRWGLDDDNIESFSLPVFGQNTWKFGLERMLLGYAMAQQEGTWRGILPYDDASGIAAGRVGQLAAFIDTLSRWQDILSETRTPVQWRETGTELLSAFFATTPDTEPVLSMVLQQWQQVLEQAIKACYDDDVPLSLIRDELSLRLDDEKISQRFLSGAINFCTLMPMRSIPFKVVCLLGMNDGVYPRNIPPLGFDLMAEQARRGDRKRRDDDRYLFLEALGSAKEHLYISYIGRSIRDNEERNPSVLVSELLEYIGLNFCLEKDRPADLDISRKAVENHLTVCHSRVPFAAENYREGAEFQSFAPQWLPAALGQGRAQGPFNVPVPDEPVKDITLDQLLRFYRHPIRAFFQQRLKVHFDIEDVALPEEEPFSVDNLQRYGFNTQLLDALVDGESEEQVFTTLKAAGSLPAGAFAQVYWEDQLQEMDVLAEKVRTARAESESELFHYVVGPYTLTGQLTGVQNDGLLRWRAAALTAVDGLRLWIEHLVYSLSDRQQFSRAFGRNDTAWVFEPLTAAQAQQYLQPLLDVFAQGLNEPLPVFIKSGWAWLSTLADEKSGELSDDEALQHKASSLLLQTLQGGFQFNGEAEDDYVVRAFRHFDTALLDAVKQLSQQLFLPMFHHQKNRENQADA
ncbi:MAG: exodeoxyribonuclease V subunit gamma [Morganella sp. (in: enterobacteria)]